MHPVFNQLPFSRASNNDAFLEWQPGSPNSLAKRYLRLSYLIANTHQTGIPQTIENEIFTYRDRGHLGLKTRSGHPAGKHQKLKRPPIVGAKLLLWT